MKRFDPMVFPPLIRVQGLWLLKMGFKVGDKVLILARENELVIKPMPENGDPDTEELKKPA